MSDTNHLPLLSVLSAPHVVGRAMTHSGKFMCTMCGKRFDTKEEVMEHAKKTHNLDLDLKAVKYFYRKC